MSLQDLFPVICSKCEFDQHTVLLRDYQSQEPFYLTTSLNDLGPKEWYAIDVSKESCQASQILDIMKEKKIKGFSAFSKAVRKSRRKLHVPLQYS